MKEGFGAPKQSLESGTQKVCPPLLPASVSVTHKGPKNEAAKPPTCPALVRKVSRANRSASCSLPLRSRHRRRHRATRLLADLPTHTRRGTVAFKLVEPGSCICSQPALPLIAAAPCVRERLGSEKRWNSLACTYVWSRVERPGCHMKRNGVALLFM